MLSRFQCRYLILGTMLAWCVMLGCAKTRQEHQREVDHEVYSTIAERNGDARWRVPKIDIRMNPESRFFEPFNQNCPPSPIDDRVSHSYMRCVDGKRGWKHWDDYGTRTELENTGWRMNLGQFGTEDQDANIQIDLDSAVRLAYLHSPLHQNQLETLYLSALDVTEERFRLDTQFFAGFDTIYNHNGRIVPASIQFDGVSDRYIVNPPSEGIESNRLTVGSGNPPAQATRRFATAGELLAGFANSFAFEFTGDDVNLAGSLANFTFIQPLLRGAGRDIALEQLTFAERNLLANLRAYSQFRQGFYTLVAVGDLGVAGPIRGSRTTNLSIFSGLAGVDGYVGLLQQQQQIRNAEDNLKLQLRSLERLEAFLDTGLIDLVQVEQFRQNIENERANLLQLRNDYLRTFDNYKRITLGLPPDAPLSLDDTLIQQFQLVSAEGTQLQDQIAIEQAVMGAMGETIRSEQLQPIIDDIQSIAEIVVALISDAQDDVTRMEEQVEKRFGYRDQASDEALQEDIAQLVADAAELSVDFDSQMQILERLANDLEASARDDANDLRTRATNLLGNFKRLTQITILVQARARLESVSIDPFRLSPETAFDIALANRLDFMNGRAALVDRWRLIAVSADALQSVLNITASGDMRSDHNNPFSLRRSTSRARLGLEFDAPFTRIIERNDYREALINYQRDRRAFIQSEDALHVDLRVLLRQIQQLEENLEIQRRSVAIAIRRVDLTQSELEAPSRPAQPGQRPPQLGPTAAINLISAQAALRDTQNSFLRAWLSYYAAKMRLARELGVMSLDSEGKWIELPLPSDGSLPGSDTEESSQASPSPTNKAAFNDVLTIGNAAVDNSLSNTADSATNDSMRTNRNFPPEVPDALIELVELVPDNYPIPIPEVPIPIPDVTVAPQRTNAQDFERRAGVLKPVFR